MATPITVDAPVVVSAKPSVTFNCMHSDSVHITFDDLGAPTIGVRFALGRWEGERFIRYRDERGSELQRDFTLSPEMAGNRLLKMASDLIEAVASDHAEKLSLKVK